VTSFTSGVCKVVVIVSKVMTSKRTWGNNISSISSPTHASFENESEVEVCTFY